MKKQQIPEFSELSESNQNFINVLCSDECRIEADISDLTIRERFEVINQIYSDVKMKVTITGTNNQKAVFTN
jgi:hypothetical protein